MRSPKLMVSVIVLGTAALIGYLTLTPSVSSSGATIAHAATSDSTVVTRRLLGGEASLDIATPSADGAFASSLDWDTGDLTVTDLRDGSVRRLHVQTSSGPSYTSYVESSRISPDGRRVAFAWIDERGTYSIRLASVDGSTPPRELYRDPKYWYLEVDGFAPDNRHVLLELDRHDGMFDYGMLDVDGGTLRPLVTGVPFVRFYAGAPLTYLRDVRLGAFCLLDTDPRGFSPEEQVELAAMADEVVVATIQHELDRALGKAKD